ncbi:MAG TPA: PLP-dependent aminotransferase family protein [Thermomicrobiales bacterium]|jgi:2-aminoadipate transaminase|nr:PLP-dependent aminotransferase family protein [Thermomicrobiales bacterium]
MATHKATAHIADRPTYTTPARRLARRASAFHESPWSVPTTLDGRHPAPISLSSGAPSESLIPVDRLAEAARQAWAEPNQWGYAGVGGYYPLREWLAHWLADRGVATDPEQIVLTTGSQQGIDLAARVFLDPGDTVIVEGPTYIGALQVFDACDATYLVAPMDDDGLDVAALERELADRAAQGHRPPKLLYSVPTFQNPTGRLMSQERREALLALARRYGIVVVEDDPYGELYFDQAPPASLRARDADVIALGTFSKTLAPALRLGWMVLPPDLVPLMANGREVFDVHGDRMSQRVVAYTVPDFLDGHVAWLREQYAERCRRLANALEASLPEGVRLSRPGGGFFLWLDLPEGLDAALMMPEAADHGVQFLPGGWFYPDRRPDPGLRLSFSNVPEEWLDEGAARLGTAIRAALAVGALDR